MRRSTEPGADAWPKIVSPLLRKRYAADEATAPLAMTPLIKARRDTPDRESEGGWSITSPENIDGSWPNWATLDPHSSKVNCQRGVSYSEGKNCYTPALARQRRAVSVSS